MVFRRVREVVLQRSNARQILIDYRMGHSNASMGDRYGRQLVEELFPVVSVLASARAGKE